MRGVTSAVRFAAWRRYGTAIWTVALAFLLTTLFARWIEPGVSPLFLAAVMFSSWRGGLGPGVLATALSALGSAFVFLPPTYSLRMDTDDALQLGVFLLTAVIISTLSIARERAEAALRRSEARYRAVFEGAPIGIALADDEGRFVESNPKVREILGYTHAELSRMTFTEFTHEQDVADGVRLHREMLEGRRDRYEHEKRYVCKDGRVIWGCLSASRVAYDDGAQHYEVRMIEDITKRKEAEFERERAHASERLARREAERANRVKDEFIAAVSHELRTPLTTIKTLTRLLLRGQQPEETRREYLEDISSECDRQIDLVLNLLDLSRIQEGGLRLALKPTDVREVLRVCHKLERFEAEERRQTLAIETPDELPAVAADHGALRRAFCGLVENAIKYTPDGGTITLRAYSAGDEVVVEVADTGRGIRAEDLPHIFDKFYRGGAGDEDAGEVPGIGLGLYLIQNIIAGCGGRITVASEQGRGSAFAVRLPVWRDDPAAGIAADAPGEATKEKPYA